MSTNACFCRCGCGASLAHKRYKAVWASESCRKAFLRGRAPANTSISRPRQRSGKQVTRGKAIDAAIRTALRFAENPDPREVYEAAHQEVDRALPARQRLEQKEAA